MTERVKSGTIVDGRYSVKHRVGAGGMAEVYCAEDLQLGRKVALKVLYGRWAEDAEFVERFRREASSAAGLQHQNVVSVYDRGEFGDTSYIAMEYVDGRTLKAVVEQEGPLPPARATALTLQVLRAARFAHKRGVIHRDLKPQNVIVDAEDRAKVTDFGIARAGASDMTQTGVLMGTAQYLSPEQAQGLPVSAQSDLYSIGIILFELLTGRVPFEGDSAVAIALRQVSEAPPAPSSVNPAVPPALDAVVLRALEKEPARRFADADEFTVALEAAVREVPAAGAQTGATAIAGVPPVVALGPPTGTIPPLAPLDGYAYPAAPLVLEEEPAPGRRWWIPLLAALLVAAAVVGGLLLFSNANKQVVVPDVVGAPQADAEVTLRNRGFDTSAVPKTAPEVAGTVIGENPGSGSKVDKGAKITLTVSSGPGQAAVPELSGQPRLAALKELRTLGFKPVEQRRTDASVGQNRVIETSPSAGQQVEKGQTVTVFISAGPQLAAVPSVTGQTQEAASAALVDAGFKVLTKPQEKAGTTAGTVLSQNPTGGTRRPKGARVTITVASAPKQVAVPDVTGQSEADATRALSAAGFEVRQKTRDSSDLAEDGKVLSQSPAGGKGVAPGSAVTITVGVVTAETTPSDTTTTPTPTTTDPATGTTGR
jgi:eukaryotic-like serine/threonine-protein kinase